MIEPGTSFHFIEGRRSRLLCFDSPLIYDDAERLYVRAPTAMVSDGASVPAALWPMIRPNWLDLAELGGLHDYLYRVGAACRLDGAWIEPTRLQADVILRGMCLKQGLREIDAAKIYYAVRIGGGSSWHRRSLHWGGA